MKMLSAALAAATLAGGASVAAIPASADAHCACRCPVVHHVVHHVYRRRVVYHYAPPPAPPAPEVVYQAPPPPPPPIFYDQPAYYAGPVWAGGPRHFFHGGWHGGWVRGGDRGGWGQRPGPWR